MHDYRIFGKEGPWLVFENGLGNSIFPWENVVEDLKNHFRILVYHRLGYGKSSGYQSMRSVDNICLELNQLLEDLKLKNLLSWWAILLVVKLHNITPKHIKKDL